MLPSLVGARLTSSPGVVGLARLVAELVVLVGVAGPVGSVLKTPGLVGIGGLAGCC